MQVTLIQQDIVWHSPEENRARLEELVASIDSTDLIILPEMFTTGFTMQPQQVAEPENLHTKKWMQMVASRYQAVVMGSFIVKEKGLYFNRCLVVFPTGETKKYDKKHTFRMAGEHEVFASGNNSLVFSWKGFTIKPFICYDLRFPVWSRNQNNEYDLAIYVANWPAKRSTAWKTLLPARAIENLCYTIGVNRVGIDGNEINYSGDSGCWDFEGQPICQLTNQEEVSTFSLSKEKLEDYRKNFPAHLDADSFQLN